MSTTTYPYALLNDVMNDDYRVRVVRRALQFRTSAADRALLDGALRASGMRVKGSFRDVTRAPVSLLLQPTLDRFRVDSTLARAVLRVWMEAESALRDEVKAFLGRGAADSPVNVSAPDAPAQSAENVSPETVPPPAPAPLPADPLPPEGFPSRWSTTEMIAAQEAYLKEHPDADKDDVALMLCCVSGRVPYFEQG